MKGIFREIVYLHFCSCLECDISSVDLFFRYIFYNWWRTYNETLLSIFWNQKLSCVFWACAIGTYFWRFRVYWSLFKQNWRHCYILGRGGSVHLTLTKTSPWERTLSDLDFKFYKILDKAFNLNNIQIKPLQKL